MSAILSIAGLRIAYGSVEVIHDIDLEVSSRDIRAILGANGSGKTTLLKAILGLVPIESGTIVLDGETELRGRQPHQIHQLGVAWAPQGRQTFSNLTTYDNLLMGAFNEKSQDRVRSRLEHMYELFPILKQRHRQLAGSLSGGEQQMLSIARALMSEPKLLLLDEPSIGLAPRIIREVFSLARAINSLGTTILLVEQNARQALRVATSVDVLESGRIVASGLPQEIEATEAIKKAYLGN